MTNEELRRKVNELLPQCVFKLRGKTQNVVGFKLFDGNLKCTETHPLEGSDLDNYSFEGIARITIKSDASSSDSKEEIYNFSGTFKEKDGEVSIPKQVNITPRY